MTGRNLVEDSNCPFFSIITVVKNGEKSIQECIDSIARQNFNDYEYIVIDGRSSDRTPEILAQN